MRKIINLMFNKYNVMRYGIDFMGYIITDPSKLSFHHLIIPEEDGGLERIENGALLMRRAHDYLHIIEHTDRPIYEAIRAEMILINFEGKIEMDRIIRINYLLKMYEEKHKEDTTEKGLILIKADFKNRFLNRVNPWDSENTA
ncbi:MAG: hypothetical protein IKO78_06350 [Bacilli bacterium]|nr:hypothetical protein [Bacilli bacterium]